MLNILNLIDECRSIGQKEPDLSEEKLRSRLAKLIVSSKIMDEDAFELGEKAYYEGKESREQGTPIEE